jgi:serine/threonine protein phosphatase 1
VIGDIHGRLDLYEALIAAIEADDVQAGAAQTTVVLLGDLVDRGPDSAGVIERTMAWSQERRVRILSGNHEEMFLQAFDDVAKLRQFVKHGGRETILSYGIPLERYNALSLEELRAELPHLVPESHVAFLREFEEFIVAGDYAFVHAGIDPGRPVTEQERHNLLWIRDRFLRHSGTHSHVIVHGHTIFDEVDDCGNRIGIDTGAYRTGRLTALVLDRETRRYLMTSDTGDSITVEQMENA